MNNISLIFPYYRNPNMLRKQLEVWRGYPPEVLDNLEIIVVDDCSMPTDRAFDVLKKELPHCNFQLFEILVKIPWNVGGARNIGVRKAKHEWVFYVDIDHIVPAHLLVKLMQQPLDKACAYRFERQQYGTGEAVSPHKEIRLIHKHLYWRIGGYDETYSGWHSLPERDFETRLKPVAVDILVRESLQVVYRAVIADASTTQFPRNMDNPPGIFEAIQEWQTERGLSYIVRTLSFPWRQLI